MMLGCFAPGDRPRKVKRRNYVVQLVIKISADEHFATTQKHFLTKLNETLVQIVKQDPDTVCGPLGPTTTSLD